MKNSISFTNTRGGGTKNNKDDNNKNKIANILMDKHPETQFGSIWSQKLVKY